MNPQSDQLTPSRRTLQAACMHILHAVSYPGETADIVGLSIHVVKQEVVDGFQAFEIQFLTLK
jgi:hypothetical protein